MKLIFVLLLSLITAHTFALTTKTKILHVTVDIDESYAEIFMIKKENGDIDHFQWEIKNDQDQAEEDTFSVEDLQSGTVFKEGIRKELVKVKGENFSEVYGGNISIRYPKNILIKDFKTEEFEIIREENTWNITHKSLDNLTKVHVTIKKALGLPIGADEVEFFE